MTRLLLVMSIVLGGCGGGPEARAARAQDVLNIMADIVNPAQLVAVEVCDAREGVIIENDSMTYEEKRTAIGRTRATCDQVFLAFERVRGAHEAAMITIEHAKKDGDWSEVDEAISMFAELWDVLEEQLKAEGLWESSTH